MGEEEKLGRRNFFPVKKGEKNKVWQRGVSEMRFAFAPCMRSVHTTNGFSLFFHLNYRGAFLSVSLSPPLSFTLVCLYSHV